MRRQASTEHSRPRCRIAHSTGPRSAAPRRAVSRSRPRPPPGAWAPAQLPLADFSPARAPSASGSDTASRTPRPSSAPQRSRNRSRLAGLDAGLLHHALVALGVALDAGEELGGRHADRLGAGAFHKLLLYLGHFQRLAYFLVDEVDDRLRSALRREQSHPDRGV